MMSYEKLATDFRSRYLQQSKKAKALDTVIPEVVSLSVQFADGNETKGRQLASTYAPLIEFLDVRPWAQNMFTAPGDPVGYQDSIWLYTGKDAMSHANQTFFPGASGVYYWALVPEMHEDSRVFPNLAGIVMPVRRDELWWNPDKSTLYRWTGDDYDCPSNFYPGATGVHQWVEHQ